MTWLRDTTSRSWDEKSRPTRIFFDWITMRDMRYVFIITGGSFSTLAFFLANHP